MGNPFLHRAPPVKLWKSWPNHAFNRTRRRGPSTWRSSVARAGYLGLVRAHSSHAQPKFAVAGFCSYNNQCALPSILPSATRRYVNHGLDFEDASIVFAGTTVEVEDARKNYGEPRVICYGLLAGRLVVVGYTPRGHHASRFQNAKGQRS